jgi:hypothetical protein
MLCVLPHINWIILIDERRESICRVGQATWARLTTVLVMAGLASRRRHASQGFGLDVGPRTSAKLWYEGLVKSSEARSPAMRRPS